MRRSCAWWARDGAKLFEAKVATEPGAIVRAIARMAETHDAHVALIGLEMGAMAGWLWRELKAWGLPVVCIDARHAHAALSTRMNSEADQRRVRGIARPPNDRGDAHGIAALMRTGWFHEVAPWSEKNQATRALMVARSRLVRMRLDA
ncbi:MAG: transposase [Pseudomonadota bacterium]